MNDYESKNELFTSLEEQEKIYNLEERTYMFASATRKFVRKIPRDICNIEDIPQLVRGSGSVAANYIEANEAVSKKDFYYRIKICKKEAKESRLFLRLLADGIRMDIEPDRKWLMQETTEFIKIFQTMLKNEPK
jgi:four helix bundle protein